MLRQDFNKNWLFEGVGIRSEVNLPHDFSILQKRSSDAPSGRGTGFFPGGIGDYEKTFLAPSSWSKKTVILEFEGVYMNATVRVNGNIVATQPYGYTSFHCDLTDYIKPGSNNTIKVNVNNSIGPNSRWYSGSGIYRPVWLLIGEKAFIHPFGVYVTTPRVSPETSLVSVKTLVENNFSSQKELLLKTTVADSKNNVVASNESVFSIPASSYHEHEETLIVKDANLWSVDSPNMYSVKSELFIDGKLCDESITPFGIRSIAFIPGQGFLLNGKKTILKGGNVHHDCGILGAASYKRAEERKIELLKKSGFNAVRCSHNPPSPAFLDACDRLGMLVMDEAFDCWREQKLSGDYHLFFDEWWEKDLGAMVLRDRNHPSIILWSTGNEIPERDGRSGGVELAKKLSEYVRKLDPTRPVTNGVNEVEKADPAFIDCLDVAGYNYEMHLYKEHEVKYPDRVIVASENYIWEDFDYWLEPEKYPNVAGDFYWTSMDYLGEPGTGKVRYATDPGDAEYPWHQAHCGDIDICGFKRPQSYYRDCLFGISKIPYLGIYRPQYYGVEVGICGWAWHDITPSWTWPGFEGKPIVAEIYGMDDEVELFHNGTSLGKKPLGKKSKYLATFKLTYEPGELKAVTYKGGAVAGCSVLRTAGSAAGIALSPDRTVLCADCDDLSYVTVELIDESGELVANSEAEVTFSISGPGELLAVGSSNPATEEMYVGTKRNLYEGRAMAVIRAQGIPGIITLEASCAGMSSEVSIQVR